MSKLQTLINRCLRRILGIYWPATISNANLWESTGQASVRKEVTSRKWTWIGHTLRSPNYCIARQALRWNPQRSRLRGRLCSSWRRDTDHTIHSPEVFPGISFSTCPGTEGTKETLSVAYVPRWENERLQISI